MSTKMIPFFNVVMKVLVLIILVLPAGCASFSGTGLQSESVRPEWKENSSADRVLPVFTTLQSEIPYNRIGFVEAVDDSTGITVRVNPERPVISLASTNFSTEKADYKNDVYRVHFQKTPFSLFPFYLTAGKHPGLLVILTRNQHNHLILVTTVHTCGCYVAIIPTGWLSRESYPLDWPEAEIRVYGETLPASLPAVVPGQFIEVVIRPGTHRVMSARVIDESDHVDRHYKVAAVQSHDSLRHLQTQTGKETSFYYSRWPLTGHVKGAFRWWEMLLLSLPSLDLFVGMDKDFGNTMKTGNTFYTSLQPWYRSASDMNDFDSFLKFYGWNL
jgi:hypothetical protein